MIPLAMFGLGVPELLIILAVVLLLFGGSRLAGLGKSTGRALKEFKEETKGLKAEDTENDQIAGPHHPAADQPAGAADTRSRIRRPTTSARTSEPSFRLSDSRGSLPSWAGRFG